jgi:hypothetical protein
VLERRFAGNLDSSSLSLMDGMLVERAAYSKKLDNPLLHNVDVLLHEIYQSVRWRLETSLFRRITVVYLHPH